MNEPVVLTVESNVEPYSIDLTLSRVFLVLNWTTMEPAPGGKVRFRFTSGDFLTADREGLKCAIRDLLRLEPGGFPASLVRDAREVLDKELAGARESSDRGNGGSKMTVLDLLAMDEPEPHRPLTLIRSEASLVADLAEQAGFEHTATLLRRLCDRAGTSELALLANLVPTKQCLHWAWQTLQQSDLGRSRRIFLKRQLQRLGGMDGKKLRAPEIYSAVVRALRKDPGLGPKAFWDSIGPDDVRLYKSGRDGRTVLKHENNEECGFGTLRRYFTRARRDLDPGPAA